jgi:hypothetical protein
MMKQYTAQLAETLVAVDGNRSPKPDQANIAEVRGLAKQLRALGQALERFKFSAFDLELKRGIYMVTGRAMTAERIRFSFSRFLSELFHGVMPHTTLTYTQDQTHLRFSTDEIEGFDVRGRVKRQDSTKMPDPYSISQILRGAGAYLDNREGTRLSGISLRGKWVTVTYETSQGQIEEANRDLEYFYDYWVKMYMRRSNRAKLPAPSEPTLFVTWERIQKAHSLTKVPG